MDANTLSLFGALIVFGVFLAWLNKSTTTSYILKVITFVGIIGAVLACAYLLIIGFLSVI